MELEHSRFDYYSELDAVEIGGESLNSSRVSQIASNLKSLASRVQKSTSAKSSASSSLADIDGRGGGGGEICPHRPLKISPLPIESMNRLELSSDHRTTTTKNNLADLPYDILIMILSHLDLKAIFSLRSTSKFFYNICSDEQFFRKLNLHPFWNLVRNYYFLIIFILFLTYFKYIILTKKVDDNLLECFTHVTNDIKMLNLSWTKFESNKTIES